jgi:poly(beta-D-mannuronate) lyase
MIRLLLLQVSLLLATFLSATNIIVKNIGELDRANKEAKPGDIIILKNGEWKNVAISLNCQGLKGNPIIFKAETAGGVKITGESSLKIGGRFIEVHGLHFTNGQSGRDAVITFRTSKKEVANNCRVANCAIDDFNNSKRMDENNWVLFFGKNNRLDHCSFINKKNMGVLLAVILDDERSRENFHSIDSNYFGRRIPLASNGGEIIRVGVSQHCQFNSNTTIRENLFEECDGETEIISIKSGSNTVSGNIFKESQGSVVLRHGDDNIVRGNIFIGNDKFGTGGVRVINKGQSVLENIFYKCRGTGFRSPLAVMNGIPNSPANRYVQVTNARILNNTWYECSPLSFAEGSDTERTLPPVQVEFAKNTIYNTRDSSIYKAWDDISGIQFSQNRINPSIKQKMVPGFVTLGKINLISVVFGLPEKEKKLARHSGATWFKKKQAKIAATSKVVSCPTTGDVYRQLANQNPVTIRLTSTHYQMDKPFVINKRVKFIGNKNQLIQIHTAKMLSAFIISGNGHLTLDGLSIDGTGVNSTHFISSDSSGQSDHFNLQIQNSIIRNLSRENGCENIFYAFKSIIADSIVFTKNALMDNSSDLFVMNNETDNKGYYNAEKIRMTGNSITNHNGILINIYRGGNDESTLGPLLIFSKNKISESGSKPGNPLIQLFGVQQSFIFNNVFSNANKQAVLLQYEDKVRADHRLGDNRMSNSGSIEINKYVSSNP